MSFPAEHAAPPKKPPRPGAQSQVGSLACLNTGDSYNDGVKVHMHMHTHSDKQRKHKSNMWLFNTQPQEDNIFMQIWMDILIKTHFCRKYTQLYKVHVLNALSINIFLLSPSPLAAPPLLPP